jgi:hypothetical protein
MSANGKTRFESCSHVSSQHKKPSWWLRSLFISCFCPKFTTHPPRQHLKTRAHLLEEHRQLLPRDETERWTVVVALVDTSHSQIQLRMFANLQHLTANVVALGELPGDILRVGRLNLIHRRDDTLKGFEGNFFKLRKRNSERKTLCQSRGAINKLLSARLTNEIL